MKRPGFERIKRRTHIRLALEHLEHRRLMAGLNVLVFTDQDGSRSLSPSVDVPAPNRLVYVDLNRDLGFDDGEPLAVSGDDGIARFPGLAAGDYLIGLAANNSAQILTTSVTPDSGARSVAAAPGSPLTSLITSNDLKHAWSVSSNGVLTPVGTDDAGRAVLNLNGQVLGVTSGATSTDSSAWALVDSGQSQPSLYQLDFQTGSARMTSVQGVANNQRISGVVRAGNQVYLQLTSGDNSYVAPLRISVGQSGVGIGQALAIPNGTLVGSAINDRLAVLGTRSQASGEDQQPGAKLSVVQISGVTAGVQSTELDQAVTNLSYSADGQWLFAALQGGGVAVFTTNGGLKSAAQLAEATGPVSAGIDGRFVTGNSGKADELIVWDSRTWSPAGRVQLPADKGSVVSLAVDSFGDRLLMATTGAALTARLSNPAPQAVTVSAREVSQATLGVRLIDRPVPLPSRIEVSQSTDEDVPFSFDLSDAVRGLGAGLFFTPGTGTSLGTFLVTPTGRVTYRTQANSNGTDSATLQVYDGVSTTTLVVSLDVRPVNDPPSSFVIDPIAIEEAATAGSSVGVATVLDVDSDARYQITTSDARFVVIDGQVQLAQSDSLDYETESSIDLEITATDLDNPAFVITRRISIPVNNSNDAPTAISLTATSVTENEDQVAIGQVVVSDPDEHGQYTYSVSDERFEFSSGQLRLRSGAVLDYESEPVISLRVTVTDSTVAGPNKSVSSDVTIQVIDTNDAPTSLSVSASDIRSGEQGAVAGRINVVDQDASDEYTFSVSDSRFMVDGNVLRLREGQSVSRDQESAVTMMVTVTDGGGGVLAQTVTLNVVNDAPFQNPRNPMDVDDDGFVYPRDALILVNQLNQKGSHILTPMSAAGEGDGEHFYPDVNGDGLLTPLDALILINFINGRGIPAVKTGNGTGGNGNGSGGTSGSSGTSTGSQSKVDDEDADPTIDDTTSQLAEGEGPSESTWAACTPWVTNTDVEEQARRDAIDSELELLVEELSRARLG